VEQYVFELERGLRTGSGRRTAGTADSTSPDTR
jgi:hypothetical protein